MVKISKFLKGSRAEMVMGMVFKFIEAMFELAVPLIMAQIIDIGIANKDMPFIYKRALWIFLLNVCGLAFALVAQYLAAKSAQRFGTTLRNEMFRHINKLSFREIDKLTTPSLITRMITDINQLQNTVNRTVRLITRAPFLLIGATVGAIIIDFKLSLIFLITAPVIAVVIYLIMKKSVPYYKDIQKKLDRISELTRENLDGVRVIRAFSKQEEEQKRFAVSNNDFADTSIRVSRISALLNPLTFLIMNSGIIAILWIGGIRVNVGAATTGEIIALINYISQILLSLMIVANMIVLYTKAHASYLRIKEVFNTVSSIKDKEETDIPHKSAALPASPQGEALNKESLSKVETAEALNEKKISRDSSASLRTTEVDSSAALRSAQNDTRMLITEKEEVSENSSASSRMKKIDSSVALRMTEIDSSTALCFAQKDNVNNFIEFKDVSFSYSDNVEYALKNISFSIKKGETIGIIGGTGSGKSTIVNLIPRFYDVTKGQILIKGRDVRDYSLKELRGKIGIVQQNTALFKGTVEENLKLKNADATDLEIENALKISQSYDFVMDYPDKTDHAIVAKGKNLSGGQKQRLAIARALIGNPEILIFDDSSSALDYATDLRLRKALAAMDGDKTLIIVSQRAATVKNADKIIVIDDGRITDTGNHSELLKKSEIYKEIYNSQMGGTAGL